MSALAIDIADAVSALGNDAIDAPLGIALGLARGLAAAARGTGGSLLGFEIVDDAISFATALADLARSGFLRARESLPSRAGLVSPSTSRMR